MVIMINYIIRYNWISLDILDQLGNLDQRDQLSNEISYDQLNNYEQFERLNQLRINKPI